MARRQIPSPAEEDSFRRIVEACFRQEAGSSASIPGDDVDLTQTGILDSMAWVSFLRSVETASGVSDLGSDLNERPASFAAVLAALANSRSVTFRAAHPDSRPDTVGSAALALIAGSSAIAGSRVIPSEEVDRAFGMPVGLLRGASTRLDCCHQRNASRLPFALRAASFPFARARKLRRA